MKIGLVLEGGAMRGMYTAGVLDTLMEQGIEFDGIVGVSAGALFGINYLSRQKGRVIRYNKRFNSDKNYMGLRPLLREGNIVSTKYAYEDVPHIYDPFDDETYRQSKVPFYAVVTDIVTGKPKYVRIRSVFEQMDMLRASGSMPFVSRPVEIGSRLYLDGALTDSIPFEWLSEQGYDQLIVVLTRDASYRKEPMAKLPVKLMYRRYPALQACLLRRHTMYNKQVATLAKWERQGKAFVIRPSQSISIGRMEKSAARLQEIYDLGCRDGADSLQAMIAYMQ